MNAVLVKRAELGLTQSELAVKAGVSRNAVRRAEAGTVPTAVVAGKLARALDLDVAKVLHPEEQAA